MRFSFSIRIFKIVFLVISLILAPVAVTGGWVLIQNFAPQFSSTWYIGLVSVAAVIAGVLIVRNVRQSAQMSVADYELLAKSSQFISLYRESPVPYLTIDNKNQIVTHNLAALRLLQASSEDLVGYQFDSILRHEDDTKLSFVLGKLQTGTTISETEMQLETWQEEMRWVLLSVFASQDSAERLVSLVDITHQKKVDLAKSEFVALATHQLRTPITAIRWNTELLAGTMKESASEKQDRYLTKIDRNIRRMLALINDFLSVSKLETGTFATDLSKINFAEFINSVIDEYVEVIEQKQLQIQKAFQDDAFTLKTDERLLHIIVSNLLSNAVKYTVDGGVIMLRFTFDETTLQFEVADSGIGIPEDELDKLFTKFFRASNAQSHRAEGTGLGLYIVRESVKKLGGTITPHSELEKGTHFNVTLPHNN